MTMATSTPSRTAMGRKRNGEPSRMPTSSTTAAAATNPISMNHGSLGSLRYVRV
jgi:hypothetical protein